MTQQSKQQSSRNDEDTAWKQILDAYFKEFIDLCVPNLSQLIDWSRPFVFLDKELQAIVKGNVAGTRLLDKLVKVFLKDGREQWILVHIEVQAKPHLDFPKRMFTYAYRIYDKYEKPLVSCAILTDEQKKWRPDHFEIGLADSYLRSKYLVIKLIDFVTELSLLEKSANPFASIIIAQLTALESKTKPDEERKKVKFSLTKRLYEKGFDRTAIINLYTFIDWLIGLPKPLELEYRNEVYQLEEAKKMPYINNAEKFGLEKGRAEGLEKGREEGLEKGRRETQQAIQEIALRLLQDGAKPALVSKVTKLPLDFIKTLQQKSEH
jgi:predicted transposase/invertase (TIGR01784 family)